MAKAIFGRACCSVKTIWLALAVTVAIGAVGSKSADAAPPTTITTRLVSDFVFTFQPNAWTGFAIGAASNSAGYVIEVSPTTDPGVDGGYFTHVVQQEFDTIGTTGWRDVARIQLLGSTVAVNANVRIYAVGPK